MNKKKIMGTILGSLMVLNLSALGVKAKPNYTLNSFTGMHKINWSRYTLDKFKLQYDLNGDKKVDNIIINCKGDCGIGTETMIINNKFKIKYDDEGEGAQVALFDLNKNDKYEEIGVRICPHQGGWSVDNVESLIFTIKVFRFDGKSIKCLGTIPNVENKKYSNEFYINNNDILSSVINSDYKEWTGKGYSIRKFYKFNPKTLKIEELK